MRLIQSDLFSLHSWIGWLLFLFSSWSICMWRPKFFSCANVHYCYNLILLTEFRIYISITVKLYIIRHEPPILVSDSRANVEFRLLFSDWRVCSHIMQREFGIYSSCSTSHRPPRTICSMKMKTPAIVFSTECANVYFATYDNKQEEKTQFQRSVWKTF